ncbi:hypothetical protein D3C85_1017760 [compost metagenome]
MGLGQSTEDGRQLGLQRRDLLVQPGQQFFLARVGVGEELGWVLVQSLNALAHGPLRIALRLQDQVDLGADFGHLFLTHLVDFGGAQGGGRVGLQAVGVEGLAVGQAPDPGVVGGLRADGLKRGDLTGQGGFDLLIDDGGGAGVIAGQVQRGGLADQRPDHGHVGGGRIAQGAHLRQHPVDDEVRRDDAQTGVLAHLVRLAVQHPGEGRQARQEGVGARRILDAVLVVHEVRRLEIGARQLGHDIGRRTARPRAISKARGLGRGLTAEGGDGVVQGAGIAEPRLIEGAQRGPAADGLVAVLADGVGTGLAQLGRQTGAGALVQAQVGGALGRLVDVGLKPAVQQGVQARVRVTGGGVSQRGRDGGRGGGGQKQAATVDHGSIPRREGRDAARPLILRLCRAGAPATQSVRRASRRSWSAPAPSAARRPGSGRCHGSP